MEAFKNDAATVPATKEFIASVTDIPHNVLTGFIMEDEGLTREETQLWPYQAL